ncbi:MAG: hypothetical protein RL094_695 [Candidatus Parcubacteria bacterium]|jgi:predicted Rossmann fold flavoprotein
MKTTSSQEGANINADILWDVVVVGGGPAGMMAAGRAAASGAQVLLLEKNPILGKKLLITGGGRCNITNAEFDTRKLLSRFKGSDKFLFSAFSEWAVQETLDFFHSRQLLTKEEAEQRVFPITEKASSVQQTLIEYIKTGGVEVRFNAEVKGFVPEDSLHSDQKKINSVELKDGTRILGKKFILATGGTSRPETGSTGDGFKWLKKIGHSVIDPTPSLVPVAVKDSWAKGLQGVTLPEVKITLLQNNVKQESKKGKILFTHFGISGPTILNLSKDIGELLKYGETVISLDLLPSLDYGKLNTRLQEVFKTNNGKKLKNCLDELILSSLVDTVIEKSDISLDTFCHSVTRDERLRLVTTLKHLNMTASHLLGTDKAIIASGGVVLEEIDFKTMQSRLYPNLYIIGDVLNIDRPSGGFSLQLCWTTGQVAGKSAGQS